MVLLNITVHEVLCALVTCVLSRACRFINARVREWRPMMARERAAQQRKTSGGTEGGKKTKTKKKAVKSSAKKATKTTTKKGRKKKQTG